MEAGSVGNPPASLLLALQKLLRPLVRLLLAQGGYLPDARESVESGVRAGSQGGVPVDA
jgi:hypothetical protein